MKINMLALVLASFLLSGCGDSSASGDQFGLGKPYHEYFKEAWATSSQGKPPLTECARVVGMATGMFTAQKDKNNEAQQAYEACYVDAFVNYANAYFALDNNAVIEGDEPKGCAMYERSLRMHKSSFDSYAERFNLDLHDLDARIRQGLGETAALCTSD